MRKFLFTAVFFSGFTSLAMEMAASRLLGNYFGSSNLVWASIIGLILIYLTAGYFIGGSWADRSPRESTFYRILCWAAFLVGLVPAVARPILRAAAAAFDQLQLGVLFGSFTSVMVLFLAPVILLGTASPFAIRLAIQDSRSAGRISGQIYAISTLGSFVGTFLPVLVLIPLLGTYRTFLTAGAVLLVVGLYGLWRSSGTRALAMHLWMPLGLLLLALFGVRGSDKNTRGLVYETESAYNYIQVLEENGYYLLRLNEGQGVHSIYNPDVLNYQGPWEQVLVAPFFNPPPYRPDQVQRMAIIGLAAGTTARQAEAVYPHMLIDGYEIDPKIVEVGRRYFAMTTPNLNIFVQDGRVGLASSPNRYQIVSVDAYRPPYIPPHMVTREFFQMVREHLTDDGVLVINVGRGPSDRRLINALASTMAPLFGSIHVMDIPNTFNSILFATVQPTSEQNLLSNYTHLAEPSQHTHPLLLETMQVTLANLRPAPEPGVVFTDDRAPIEWMTNELILSYLLIDPGDTPQ